MDNKKLTSDLLKASQTIHQRTIRGSGNYMIVSSKVADVIRHLDILEERKDKINRIIKRMKNGYI